MKNWTLVLSLLLLTNFGYGQSTKKKKKVKKKAKTEKATPRLEQQSNSYAPFSPEETKEAVSPAKVKKSKKKSAYASYNITMEQKVEEFKERMEANAKAEKKKNKEMKKPQYSDPSYFGHKRKPKIRKVKKRKFCKECGITH